MTTAKPILPKFSNPSHSPTSLFPYPYSYTLTSERSFTQVNKSLSKLLHDDIHIFLKKKPNNPYVCASRRPGHGTDEGTGVCSTLGRISLMVRSLAVILCPSTSWYRGIWCQMLQRQAPQNHHVNSYGLFCQQANCSGAPGNSRANVP